MEYMQHHRIECLSGLYHTMSGINGVIQVVESNGVIHGVGKCNASVLEYVYVPSVHMYISA
eukprot:7188891-Ditylum_brightwellii.AAC.2